MGFASIPVLVLGLLTPQLIAAISLQPRQVSCDFSTAANSGDTCSSFAGEWGLTVAAFEALNPGVVCPNLVAGTNYCVIGTPAAPTSSSTTPAATTSSSTVTTTTTSTSSKATTTTSTSSKATTSSTSSTTHTTLSTVTTTTSTSTTTTGNGISTPTPYQTGMVTNCNSFHLVVGGDQCGNLATTYGITLANFYLWNPAVGSSCAFLDLGDYVCVGIIGGSTTATTTSATTTTSSGNGITTPTPFQAGMTTNCDSFHLVVSGDQCGNLATTYGISLANFYLWNPAVGSSCAFLDLGDYVCVNIIGGTATTTSVPTTTSSGNGITTPTPIQPGMVTDCDSFHLVVSGDQCGNLATTYGITLANFYLWNPAVGSTCATLDLGDYVCVGIK